MAVSTGEEVTCRYESFDAPTGEGTVWVTASGQIWRRCFVRPVITGVMYGWFQAGIIWPAGP